MSVVFDEVVGTVEAPQRANAEEQHPAPRHKSDDRQARALLKRLERREARLRAD